MAVTVADLEIVVGADISGAERGLSGLDQQVKNTGKGGGGFLSGLTGGLLGFGKTALKTIGVVGGLTSLPIIGGGLKSAWGQVDSVEQATVALRAYEKDATKVDAVLGDLLGYARSDEGVLFSRQELFGAAQSMKMYGAETENVADYTKIMSRSVGLGLSNWDDLNRVIGRVGSTGRLTGEDFDFLKAAGFQLDDSLRNTNLTWDQLFSAMDQGIPADAMAGQADTIRGKTIRLQSAMRNLGLSILGVDKDTSKFIEGGLGDMLFKGLDKARIGLNAVAPLFGMLGSAAATGLGKIGSVIGPVFDGVTKFLNKFYELKDTYGIVRGAMFALADVLTETMGPKFANTVLNAMLTVERGIKGVVGTVKDFGSYLKDVWTTGDALTKSLNKLPKPLQKFAKPLGVVVESAKDLTNAFKKSGLSGLLKQLPKELKDVGKAFGDFGKDLYDGVRGAFRSVNWSGIGSDFLSRARSVFNSIPWASIFNTLTSAGAWIVDKLGDAASAIASWFSEQVSKVNWRDLLVQGWNTITNIASVFVDKLGDIADGVSSWFSEQVGRVDWRGLLDTALSVVGNAAIDLGSWVLNTGIPAITGWIADNAGGIWDGIKSAAGWVWNGLANLGSWVLDTAIPAIGGWIADNADDVWGGIKAVVGWVWDGLVDLGSWVLSVALPTVGGWLANGTTAVVSWLQTKIGQITANLPSWWLNVGKPTVNLLSDISIDVLQKIGNFIVEVAKGAWSILLGNPTIVKGFDLNAAIRDAIGSTFYYAAKLAINIAKVVLENPTETIIAIGAAAALVLIIPALPLLLPILLVLGAIAGLHLVYSKIREYLRENPQKAEELKVEVKALLQLLGVDGKNELIAAIIAATAITALLIPFGITAGLIFLAVVGAALLLWEVGKWVYNYVKNNPLDVYDIMVKFALELQELINNLPSHEEIVSKISSWLGLGEDNVLVFTVNVIIDFITGDFDTRAPADGDRSSGDYKDEHPDLITPDDVMRPNNTSNFMSPKGGSKGQSGGIPAAFQSIIAGAGLAKTAVTEFETSGKASFGGLRTSSDENLVPIPTTVGALAASLLTRAHPAFAALLTSANTNFVGVKGSADTNFSGLGAIIGGHTLGAKIAGAANLAALKSSVDSETKGAKSSADTNASSMARLVGSHAMKMAQDAAKQSADMNSKVSAEALQMQSKTVAQTLSMQTTSARHFSTFASHAQTQSQAVSRALQSNMASATSAVSSNASQWRGIIASAGGSAAGAAAAVGSNIGNSLASALRGTIGAVRGAANALIAEVDRAMRAKAQIKSPSRMTTYFGSMLGEGLVVGMNDMVRDVSRMGTQLANASLVQPQTPVLAHTPSYAYANTGSGMGGNGHGTVTVYQTNHYTVTVDELEDLNQAVEFVKDLDRERELIFS